MTKTYSVENVTMPAFGFLLGLSGLIAHLGLSVVGGSGFLVLFFLIYGGFFVINRKLGFMILITILFYQNLVLSLFTTAIGDRFLFQSLQGIHFGALVIVSLISAVFLFNSEITRERRIRGLLILCCLGIVVVIFYAIYGAFQSSVSSAVIYFRNITGPVFFAIVGLYIGLRYHVDDVSRWIVVLALPSILFGLWELVAPYSFYKIISADQYYSLKSEGRVLWFSVADLVFHQMHRFFNLPTQIDLKSFRIGGANMHSVSFGYILSIVSLLCITQRWHLLSAASITLLLISGTKGPVIMFFGAMILYALALLVRTRLAICTIALLFGVAYVTGTIMYGITVGDYHIIGLLGGFTETWENPLGRGVGVGGNLSDLAGSSLDWRNFSRFGATFALESAIGVLMYQLGVGAIVVLAVYFWLSMSLFGLLSIDTVCPRLLMIPLATYIVVLNGLFQEEAFSPYALGLLACLCGIIVSGNRHLGIRKLGRIGDAHGQALSGGGDRVRQRRIPLRG